MPTPITGADGRQLPGGRAARRVSRVLEWIEDAGTSVVVLLIFALVVTQVTSRHFLHLPVFWIEETARLGMVWLTFVAAAMVTARGAHLTVTAIAERLPGVLPRVFSWLGQFAVLFTALVLTPASWDLLAAVGGVSSSSGGMPRGALFAAPLVGFALTGIHALINVVWRDPSDLSGEAAL